MGKKWIFETFKEKPLRKNKGILKNFKQSETDYKNFLKCYYELESWNSKFSKVLYEYKLN